VLLLEKQDGTMVPGGSGTAPQLLMTRLPNLETILLPALLAMAMDGSGDCKDEMKLLFSLRHLLRYRIEFQWQCVFSERD